MGLEARPRSWGLRTLLPLLLSGLALCRLLGVVGAWAWLPAVVFGAFELWLLVKALREVRALLRSRRTDSVHELMRSMLERRVGPGRLARLLAYELSMYLYAFTRRAPRVHSNAAGFRHQGEDTWRQLVWGLSILSVVEGAVVHLLLGQLSVVAAWILSALQLYGVIWLLADLEALRQNPVVAGPDGLTVALGMRVAARIPWQAVERVEHVGERVKGPLRAHLGSTPNLLLVLKDPQPVMLAFGITRAHDRILLSLDEPARFALAVSEMLGLSARAPGR